MVFAKEKEALGGEEASKSSDSNQSMTSPLSQDAAKTVFGSSTPLQCNLCVHHCLNTLVINKAHSSSRGGHAEQGTATTRPRHCDSQLIRRAMAAVIQDIPLHGLGAAFRYLQIKTLSY